MRLSSGIHDMGPVEWDLALSLLGAWVIAFLCMIKGIKSSGKVKTNDHSANDNYFLFGNLCMHEPDLSNLLWHAQVKV